MNSNRNVKQILQVAFTYIGTVVGAGFASGQEILQFYTQYGRAAAITIPIATLLFMWLGTKLLLLAHSLKARSYEDLNRYVFGDRIGVWVSVFTMIVLFGTASVMLAGAGSIFEEHMQLPYQLGLIITLVLAYIVIINGMSAIMAVNSLIVPLMLIFTCIVVYYAGFSPTADNWLRVTSDRPIILAWTAPLLYAAFNLSMAQAVLVPLGGAIRDRKVLIWGGRIGGLGIGVLLLSVHIALSAQMPGIQQFDIPTGHLIRQVGTVVQLLFIFVIYAEVFTTFVADVYGLSLQLRGTRSQAVKRVTALVLAAAFICSQFGFKLLLSWLYPIFGSISLIWFFMVIWRSKKK